MLEHQPTGKSLYILTQSVSADLHNGFIYIKELLLQHHAFYMYRSIETLKKNGIQVYSIKTDALTINSNDLARAQELLDFSPGLGKWRHSGTGKDIKFPTKPLDKAVNNLIKINTIKVNNIPITIEQEHDTEYICKEIVEPNKTLLIKARYAGSGKSYICEYMRKLRFPANSGKSVSDRHKTLFICPTNELAEKYGEDGITINKFFGFGISEEEQKFMNKFDANKYDTIVFDEIFLNNVRY